VAFCQNAFSTTVAGAAPDFDRLPDFPPSLAGRHLELDNHLTIRRGHALHCGTTQLKSFATSDEVAKAAGILEILYCFPRSAVTRQFCSGKTWRKWTTEINSQDLRCGKPRETSIE